MLDVMGDKVALGFKVRNHRLIVKMENVIQERENIYEGIKTI
jgi:hypothetical protein